MNLFKLVKKYVFIILAIMCILLLIINNIKKPKIKEKLTVCDDTCSSVTDGRINFLKFNQNIAKLMELMGRLRGHCKKRCDDNSENFQPEPLASNHDASDDASDDAQCFNYPCAFKYDENGNESNTCDRDEVTENCPKYTKCVNKFCRKPSDTE